MRQKNHSKSQRHQPYYHSIPADLETFPFIDRSNLSVFLQMFAKNATGLVKGTIFIHFEH